MFGLDKKLNFSVFWLKKNSEMCDWKIDNNFKSHKI